MELTIGYRYEASKLGKAFAVYGLPPHVPQDSRKWYGLHYIWIRCLFCYYVPGGSSLTNVIEDVKHITGMDPALSTEVLEDMMGDV